VHVVYSIYGEEERVCNQPQCGERGDGADVLSEQGGNELQIFMHLRPFPPYLQVMQFLCLGLR
jgi:hypothetical protein